MRKRFFFLIAVSALFLLTGCELKFGTNNSENSTIKNAELYYADGNLTFDSNSMYPMDGNELPSSYNDYEIKSFPSGSILRAKLIENVSVVEIGDVIVFKDKTLITDDYDGTNVKRIVDIKDDLYILQGDRTASLMYYYTDILAESEGLTTEEKDSANKYLLDNNYISVITKGSILAKVESIVLPK